MAPESGKPQQAWYWHWFWYDVDVWKHLRSITNRNQYNLQMYQLLDDNGIRGFNVRIYCVASLGFLASSYSLFATSIIWPALDFVYPNVSGSAGILGQTIDLVTLAGTILGMITFGHLSDRLGRRRLYGLELIIIGITTIGIVFSSSGYMVPPSAPVDSPYFNRSSMNVITAVATWRFFLGVGIGAEYPMSAIIAAEFVSTQSRGKTMAAVFLMQSVGRLMALGFANAFLKGQINALGVNHADSESYQYGMKLVIDQTWRFVAGFGGLFAVAAILLRLTIPESPRYYPDIAKDVRETMEPVRTQGPPAGNRRSSNPANSGVGQIETTTTPTTKWIVAAWRYLTLTPAWKPFLMMCSLWFFLDVCFYGTGLDSPSTLNILWLSRTPPKANNPAASWEEDPANLTESIYTVLYNDGNRGIEVSSISSLVGSATVIILINRVSRRSLLLWTSIVLSAIFFITGALVKTKYASTSNIASMVFYALAQFFFNLGPNTVVFILAAEIFPTMFRGTLYGLVAASGKTGALLIRPFVHIAASKAQDNDPSALAAMLFTFGAIMLTVACMTWRASCLPEVQDDPGAALRRRGNRHLEDIAPNPSRGALVLRQNSRPQGSTVPLQDLTPDNVAQAREPILVSGGLPELTTFQETESRPTEAVV